MKQKYSIQQREKIEKYLLTLFRSFSSSSSSNIPAFPRLPLILHVNQSLYYHFQWNRAKTSSAKQVHTKPHTVMNSGTVRADMRAPVEETVAAYLSSIGGASGASGETCSLHREPIHWIILLVFFLIQPSWLCAIIPQSFGFFQILVNYESNNQLDVRPSLRGYKEFMVTKDRVSWSVCLSR